LTNEIFRINFKWTIIIKRLGFSLPHPSLCCSPAHAPQRPQPPFRKRGTAVAASPIRQQEPGPCQFLSCRITLLVSLGFQKVPSQLLPWPWPQSAFVGTSQGSPCSSRCCLAAQQIILCLGQQEGGQPASRRRRWCRACRGLERLQRGQRKRRAGGEGELPAVSKSDLRPCLSSNLLLLYLSFFY
jgi:hypothetical protein